MVGDSTKSFITIQFKEVTNMARERTVKLPPRKRGGKLTVHQIRRAVRKVVRERLEREAKEAAEQADAHLSEKK